MNELAYSISLLYEPDIAPVIGVSGGMILFFNSAARSLFPTIETQQRASAVLPDAFLDCDENVFISTAQVGQKSISASGVWYNGLLLLRLNTTSTKYVFSAESHTASMRLELSKMRLALEQLSSNISINADTCQNSCISVLYHSYYKLLRSCENLELANHLNARKTVFRPARVNLADWLKELVSIISEACQNLGVAFSLNCPDDLSLISVDPDLLEHLMLNLISNSLHHCKPGCKISIRVVRKGSKLQLFVDDTGSGFPVDQLGSLFQRQTGTEENLFARNDNLGLFIVWGIAEMHGGSVTITNRRKNGASVRLTLPIERADYLQLRSPSEDYASEHASKRRILTGLADVLPDAAFLPEA